LHSVHLELQAGNAAKYKITKILELPAYQTIKGDHSAMLQCDRILVARMG
jgi:hypothetical protein